MALQALGFNDSCIQQMQPNTEGEGCASDPRDPSPASDRGSRGRCCERDSCSAPLCGDAAIDEGNPPPPCRPIETLTILGRPGFLAHRAK